MLWFQMIRSQFPTWHFWTTTCGFHFNTRQKFYAAAWISKIFKWFLNFFPYWLLSDSSLKTICELNLAPAVNKMLSNCDNIIQQHKAACLKVTSLLACKDIIWVGTSAGVLLTILAKNLGKSTPVVTGNAYHFS